VPDVFLHRPKVTRKSRATTTTAAAATTTTRRRRRRRRRRNITDGTILYLLLARDQSLYADNE
jgi:hypothetical protein